MRVGEILIDHLVDQVKDLSIRLIVIPETLFFLYGFTLVVEIFLCDG